MPRTSPRISSRPLVSCAILALAGLTTACSGGETVPDATPAEATASGPAEAIERCYVGTTTITGPDDEVLVDRAPTILWRTFEPDKGLIVERTVNFDGRRVEEMSLQFNVEGDRFVGSGVDYAVSGQLIGEPWAWQAWTSTSTFPDGSRVDSRERIDGEVLRSEKVFHNAGEAAQITAVEELVESHDDHCEATVAELRTRIVHL